ncbi:hypothetical protein C8Q74DRAFT_206449 [Fomes fomentarius]|nr:hypothetical protein C8Q74DRAFT_206449 [Fomes fomentarius]
MKQFITSQAIVVLADASVITVLRAGVDRTCVIRNSVLALLDGSWNDYNRYSLPTPIGESCKGSWYGARRIPTGEHMQEGVAYSSRHARIAHRCSDRVRAALQAG